MLGSTPTLGAGSPNLLLNQQFIGPDALPSAPVANFSTSTNSVHLSWTQNTSIGGGVANFLVYKGSSPGGEGASPVATLSASTFSWDDSVTTGTPAYYQVAASNGGGETRSAELTVAPPAAPVATATPGDHHVLLQWGAITASPAVTGYTVKRSTTPGGPYSTTVGSVSATTLSLDDIDTGAGPTNGTTYYYVVTADSDWGSGQSAEVSASPIASTGTYFPLPPTRIMDSRTGNGTTLAPFTGGAPRTLQVTGRGGVPGNGTTNPVTAVVMNVTVTNPTAPSHLTVYPADQSLAHGVEPQLRGRSDRAQPGHRAGGPGCQLRPGEDRARRGKRRRDRRRGRLLQR